MFFYLGCVMRKPIDLRDLEVDFNKQCAAIDDCLFSFTPQALFLKKNLINQLSDIELIKDLSYSFKLCIKESMERFQIHEPNTLHSINTEVFNLECYLVNMSKYDFKIETMKKWFSTFTNLQIFIRLSGHASVVEKLPEADKVDNKTETDLLNTPALMKFSHLL